MPTLLPVPVRDDPAVVGDQIEGFVCQLVSELTPAPAAAGRNRGRPPILPAALLWAGVLVMVLRRVPSQRALWRLLSSRGLWHFPAVPVTDDAIYKRLASEGPAAMHALFDTITALLLAQLTPAADTTLAPFAAEVVVFDETTLDPVARKLPLLRQVPRGSDQLLPGKLAAIYDVRRQLWRYLHYIDEPHQNEKRAARQLLAEVPTGSLILADLGYYSFAWFDELTAGGYFWIQRLRNGSSYEVLHTYYADADTGTLDALIWLGKHRADRAGHAVRLVQFTEGAFQYRYITNVCDPDLLPLREIARLYHRRWDIELAFNLVKTHLGLHLLWSSKEAVLLTQVWAVLIIAQILHALRTLVAQAAQVDPFEVSLPLLIEYLPQYAARHADPMTAFLADAVRLGFIRPSRRTQIRAPDIPASALQPLPADLVLVRKPRYAHRKPSKSGGGAN
jgi:hypothetical protein